MQIDKMPEILTLAQACEILNCHPNTLRNWENKGLIKCIRFGSRGDRRFKKEEVLKLIKNENENYEKRSISKN